MEDSIFNLATKVLSLSASAEEEAAFKAKLAKNEQLAAEYEELKAIWELSGKTAQPIYAPSDWQKVEQKIMQPDEEPNRPFFFNKTQWMAAASVILLLALSLFFYQDTKWSRAVAQHNNTQILLPDGSEVWLKEGSQLKWRKDFAQDRRVELRGKAFFNVKRNESSPFTVKCENTNTTVLGTSFLLEKQGNNEVKITVTEGRVQFKNKANSVVLQKDEAAISKATELNKLKGIKQNDLSWVSGEIIFENTPLKEVFEVMEHHFGLSIEVDKQILDLSYSGRYKQPKADEMAKDLETILAIRILKNNREWRVSKP